MKYKNSPFTAATQNSSFIKGQTKCCQPRVKTSAELALTGETPKVTSKLTSKTSITPKTKTSNNITKIATDNWAQTAGLIIQGVSTLANVYLGFKQLAVANKQGAAASSNDRNNTWLAKEKIRSYKNRLAAQAQYQMHNQSIESEAQLKSLYNSSGGLNAQGQTVDWSPDLTYYDWNKGGTAGFKEQGRNEAAYNAYQNELKKVNGGQQSAFAPTQTPNKKLATSTQSAMGTNAIGGPDTQSQIVTKPGAVVRKKSLGAEPTIEKEIKDKKSQLAIA